ncbi:MAG TPA: hypothetical protein VJB15_00380, partial [Rhodothermia bacterium]|nr:hypothetical protein [Rhodothermia bacterium]
RLTDVYLDGEHLLTAKHGPMDVDPVHEADTHTPFTTIDRPVASAVFGGLDDIAYTRTAGTPYGFVRFVPTMARFLVRDTLIVAPDATLLASLKRRNLLSLATLNPTPLLGFDKASSSLFVPPEFFSVNCVTCYGGASGFDIDRAGSGEVSIGQTVYFVADAISSYCYQWYFWEDIPGYTQPEVFAHEIRIDGSYVGTLYGPYTGEYENTEYLEFGVSFLSDGPKTVRDTLYCSACPAVFSVSAEKTVEEVCDPVHVYGNSAVALFGRSPAAQLRYAFSNPQPNIFSFLLRFGGAATISPPDQETISNQSLQWDAQRVACGETWNSDISVVWSSPLGATVIMSIVPGLSNAGEWEPDSCSGVDCIRLNPNRQSTTMAHEVGHLLGFFSHSINPIDLMCNESCALRAVQSWHIKKLIEHYF